MTGVGPAGRAGNTALHQPRSVAAQLVAGAAYMRAEQYNDAFICYSRAIAADPNSYEGQLGLARVCAYLGNVADGLEAARQARALKPAEGGPRITSGLLKLASFRGLKDPKEQLKVLTEAAKLLDAGVRIAADDPDGWKGLGEARARLAQVRLETLRAAAARGQQTSQAADQQISTDLAGAITAYQRARTYSPQEADLSYALGRLYQAQGQPDAAEKSLREATRLAPQNPAYQVALAWLLIGRGKDPQTAREAAQTALQLGETTGEAALAGAVALLKQGDARAAIKEITGLLRQYGEKPDLLYWYGEALLGLDPREAAADPELKDLDPLRRAVAAYEVLERQVLQGAPCRATPQDVRNLRDRLAARMKAAMAQAPPGKAR